MGAVDPPPRCVMFQPLRHTNRKRSGTMEHNHSNSRSEKRCTGKSPARKGRMGHLSNSAASSITYGAQKACGMTTATTATTTTTKGTTECRRAMEQTLGQQDRLAKLIPRAVANYLEDHRTEQAQTPVPCWEE